MTKPARKKITKSTHVEKATPNDRRQIKKESKEKSIDPVVIVLVIALLIVAVYSIVNGTTTMIQRQASVVPTLSPTPAIAPEVLYQGTYSAQLKAASATARTVTLTLREDRTAELKQEYQNKKTPIIETGEWAPNETGVEIRFTKLGSEIIKNPKTMTFDQQNNSLVMTDQDTKAWGEETIILFKQNELSQTRWVWKETVMSDDKKITTDKKESFSLDFGSTGSVSITTDCNNGTATYTITKNALEFGPLASTKKYCEGSLETEFFKQLTQVESFLLKESNLHLQLRLDSGTMTFVKTR